MTRTTLDLAVLNVARKALENNPTNTKKVLLYNRKEWELHRLVPKLELNFTDKQLDKAEKSKNGFIGTRNAVDCYLSQKIK